MTKRGRTASVPPSRERGEGAPGPIRCAIYTRKSSEEGLELEFNSLDAQREAAEAYIASQRNEGWICLPDRYDDGGFSGGSMERPALEQLLKDIEAGKVDCVVVYKVDRLSRSLMDFARIMQTFDRKGVSFVSVTQQFNTTSSMGRLTLHILLSFAQFEREIIGERIRDKIAAQKRRGKWAGGVPILGYDVDRSGGSPRLVVNPREAAKVRAIFQIYLDKGSLQRAVMPRGSGKTSLCEVACLWALLYGHREFVALIGSDEEHAAGMLESIKAELENSEILGADFPEVCHPIRSLEGIHQRASGQLYQGKQTHIGWTAREIVLPTIPGSAASGAIIRVAGITGRIRGMKHKRVDGVSVRPSLVLIDDPQTDESARSPSQCANRERILAGAILGLAGPGRKIAGLMTLTVVRPDDLADRILDRDKHPQWQGERTKMVYSFPTADRLWAEYARLRAEGLKADQGGAEATAFYRAHRTKMDAGAVIAWPERFNHDELSAVQHAINLRLQNEAAFFAEYQNEPLPEVEVADDLLSSDQIAAKMNGHARGLVPLGCSHLTMFVDVQGKALFYLVAAWEDDFTGHIIDYGTEPDQKQAYFTLRDIKRTLGAASPRAGVEGAIYGGLERLLEATVAREWRRDDGALVRIDRCLIDANWGSSTDVVYQFCRQSPHASVLMPSHGRYVGASSLPFSDYKRKRGERVGLNWRVPVVTGKRAVRHVLFDTNFWKSFVHARLVVPMGDPGGLSLFGHKPEHHRLLAEHLTSEYRVRTEGRGRTVDEWKLRVDGLDNHWLDGLVGCAVAASMQGAVLFGTDQKVLARPRLKLSALKERAR